ncbi:MAG: hypothetical protein HYZ17_03630 [Betaproteobacteria bacterium]|nr:hypothetical protein [Betaproteobacteria bacterium]
MLEQADALMRRNRDAGVDDVPVLTEVVPTSPAILDDTPVLTAIVESPVSASGDWRNDDGPGIDIDADLAEMGPDFPKVATDTPLKEPEFVPLTGRGEVRVPMLEIPPEKHHYRLDPVSAPIINAAPSVAAKASSGISGEMLEKTLPLSELLAAPTVRTFEAQFFDLPPGVPIPAPAAPKPASPEATVAAPKVEVPAPPEPVSPPEPHKEVDLSALTQEFTEQITLQVLQKLDIYTERGLQEHLLQHLKPVVERAVGELVSTINTNVGRVIRAFVAEAIEREIDSFRKEIAEAVKHAHQQD